MFNGDQEQQHPSDASFTSSEVQSAPPTTAFILPEQLCTASNHKLIVQALKKTITRIPKKFQHYYLEYQNTHQREFLKYVNYIGQLLFLSYFLMDWLLLPDILSQSAITRLVLVVIAMLINFLSFRYCQNIKILDSLMPTYCAIAAASWLYLLSLSHNPIVDTYIYAACMFILLGNLCIQVSFRYSVFTSLLISSVTFYGVFNLVEGAEALSCVLIYGSILALSMYISWNNTANSKRNFLRVLLNDWNYYALSELAHTDELTQLNNRRQFMQRAEKAIQKWTKYNMACLLMLDIDFFKQINDTYGHDVGDEVLQILAEITRKEMRYTDILARFGGEEFIALLPNTTLNEAEAIADRLCQKIKNHQICIDDKFFFNFSVSIGVAQLKPHEKDLTLLIKNADIALYQAKENGRNQVAVYSCDA